MQGVRQQIVGTATAEETSVDQPQVLYWDNNSAKICRCCLANSGPPDIYEEINADTLKNHINLFLIEDFRLPLSICQKCASFLRDVKKFRETARASHTTLLQAITNRQNNNGKSAQDACTNTVEPYYYTVSDECSEVKNEVDVEGNPLGCTDPLGNTETTIVEDDRNGEEVITESDTSKEQYDDHMYCLPSPLQNLINAVKNEPLSEIDYMQDSGRKMDLVYTTELMLNMHYKELQPDVNDNEIDSNKKSNETVPNKECNEIDSDTKYNKTEPGKASPNDESRNRRKKRLKNKKAQRKKEEKICKDEQPGSGESSLLTPVPFPINTHTDCEDPFCPEHEDNDVAIPSVDTVHTDSDMQSAAPAQNRRKKRSRNYDNWGDVKRKKLKNLGKTYCTKKGRTVQEKLMRPACRCKFQCADKVTEEQRKDIFRKFWELGDREKQWSYVANYTKILQKSRTSVNGRKLKHNREYTYNYFLPKDQSYAKINVCKTMFLNTLSISERMTRTAWDKYDGTTAVGKDLRGCHIKHKKVIDDEMIKSVRAHVNSFVPESHCCRQSSTRLYLDGSLNVARMFALYKEWFDLERYEKPAKTLRQYRDIVNSHFNLAFRAPKKDACDRYHSIKKTENPYELKADHAKHTQNKKIARQLIKLAINN